MLSSFYSVNSGDNLENINMSMKVIVIDPGHGGDFRKGKSSPNNATSPSGVKEKDINLDIAKRIKKRLIDQSQVEGIELTVVLTRESDTNLSLVDRAEMANSNSATLYLSIHCNGFSDSRARGTECWIDRKYMEPKKQLVAGSDMSMPGPGLPASGTRNVNVKRDEELAKSVVDATIKGLKKFDSSAKLRSDRYTRNTNGESYTPPKGVKMMGLGTLRDAKLGTSANNCRSALLELEFITNPRVDQLLNGGNSVAVREAISKEIAGSLLSFIR